MEKVIVNIILIIAAIVFFAMGMCSDGIVCLVWLIALIWDVIKLIEIDTDYFRHY